jgi:hypothetical protein
MPHNPRAVRKAYGAVQDTCPADPYFLSNTTPETLALMDELSAEPIRPQYHTFVGDQYDAHYLANVGWDRINETNDGYRMFFSQENMDHLSQAISARLLEAGMRMVVTPRVIGGVMSDILRTHTPQMGDIYTRYTIPQEAPRNDLANLNERVINTIVSTIINEEDARKWNESLTVWDTVYGDFNRHGLRAHSIIRKKDKDILKGQFNLNY